ncbi:MAG: GTPase Era [Cyclobacteriaceae bacterium]|nr:GTPase Era [Cyclobacteriaceae bacterium HetDA_MAG_MS6]
MSTPFKSGFVSILGKPNVGKSTLMNALTGERLSIITSKAQTTRHRIFGILTGSDFQVVYSDTPGVIDPQYKLQESMMKFVKSSLEDADVILYVVELGEKFEHNPVIDILVATDIPVFLVINKIDQAKGSQLHDKVEYWKEKLPTIPSMQVSALEKLNLEELFSAIKNKLPEHPPFFPEDTLTDKPERFFAAENIREKIFLNYKKEVPYSTEVEIEEFHEEEAIIRMRAVIYVERDSQKGIIIGKKGESLKKVGIQARADLEQFFGKQVYLETYVKVEKDWRKKEKNLKRFGYLN